MGLYTCTPSRTGLKQDAEDVTVQPATLHYGTQCSALEDYTFQRKTPSSPWVSVLDCVLVMPHLWRTLLQFNNSCLCACGLLSEQVQAPSESTTREVRLSEHTQCVFFDLPNLWLRFGDVYATHTTCLGYRVIAHFMTLLPPNESNTPFPAREPGL